MKSLIVCIYEQLTNFNKLLESFTIKHNKKEIKNQTFMILTIFLVTLFSVFKYESNLSS